MSRDGFDHADIDTGLFADPKVLALARRQRDTIRTLAAVALYLVPTLASWKAGDRQRASDALPGWALDPVGDLIADLIAVGLLDDDERVRDHAFESWFGTALGRRLDADFGRVVGGLVRNGMPRPEAIKEAKRRQAERISQLSTAANKPGSQRGTVLPSFRQSDHPAFKPDMVGDSTNGAARPTPDGAGPAPRPPSDLEPLGDILLAHGLDPSIARVGLPGDSPEIARPEPGSEVAS